VFAAYALAAICSAPCVRRACARCLSARARIQIITYSDLESDYINPVDASERLNRFLIPEYVAHAGITLLFLLTLNFVPLVANGVLVAWNTKRFLEGEHLVDATKIYPTLAERKKQSLVKLGFYVVSGRKACGEAERCGLRRTANLGFGAYPAPWPRPRRRAAQIMFFYYLYRMVFALVWGRIAAQQAAAPTGR